MVATSQPSNQYQKYSNVAYTRGVISNIVQRNSYLFHISESLDESSIKSRMIKQAVTILTRFAIHVLKIKDIPVSSSHILQLKRIFDCCEIDALSSVLLEMFLNHFHIFEKYYASSQFLWFLSTYLSSYKSDYHFTLNSVFFPLTFHDSPTHSYAFPEIPTSFQMVQQSSMFNACIFPPITQTILQELELQEILKNVQLRHDIVHNTNLQFRPNFDGERGKKKRFLANKYWKGLRKEIEQVRAFQMRKNNLSISHKYPCVARIFVLFVELRNILLNLLPSSNRAYIIDILDPNLIIQELIHNLFDIEKFVEHLVNILKQHCAPMRDLLLDKMAQKIRSGLRFNNISKLVGGLRMIFDILEMMKLDVINHQLRTLRVYFLKTAVEFEQKWFIDRVNWGDIDITDAMSWYCHFHYFLESDLKNPDYQKSLVNGVMASITYVSLFNFPSTFTFDMPRLMSLRSNIRDIVSFQLTFLLLYQLLQNQTQKLLRDDIVKFKQKIWLIANEEFGDDKWLNTIPSISALIVEYVSMVKSRFSDNTLNSVKITIIENWLYRHLSPISSLYRMVENRILKSIGDRIYRSLCISNKKNLLFLSNNIQRELYNLFADMVVERLIKIVVFHWKVFGKWYIEYAKNKFT
ncbi:hypothetical protein PCANB_002315 [Pneumocystis canis]|nr:hypothetical protein PCK1_002424 [Pneumocystis canis]KAG5438985.1 hypothetical protein PCANB_002315 [Pneumocystis canis]